MKRDKPTKLPQPGRFEDQVAVVTGAATGLGRAIAARLAAEGGRVAVLDRDAGRLSNVVDELRHEGRVVEGRDVDIGDEASVQGALDEVRSLFGPPDIVVNCAGIVGPTSRKIVDYGTSSFDTVYRVNLLGSFLITKYSLPSMLEKGYGRILLIASIAGKEGNPGMCGYSASKAGVIGLVKGIAKEYADTGVTVNGLAPAVVMTDLVRNADPAQVAYMTDKIPMRRCGTLEEVAAAAAWIVSKECSFSTGFTFDLSGGRATY